MDIANIRQWLGGHWKHPAAMVGVCASPLLVLAGIWLLVNALVLTPGVPGDSAAAVQCINFAVDPAGLPRLRPEQQAEFVETHLSRVVRDGQFRDAFMTGLRRQPLQDQAAFRAHVFDALLPRFVSEAQEYQQRTPEELDRWLEDRLVHYKRMGRMLRGMQLEAADFDSRWTDEKGLLELVIARTTPEQRASCGVYFAALARESAAIKQDPERLARLEERLAPSGR